MPQLAEVQEFVAETRERDALMTTRRYQWGSICKSENGEVWYGKYYPAPGAPQKRVQLGRTAEKDEKAARVALDDIVAVLNRNPAHALGAEPVRRFVEQVYIPQKYENGDWRRASGQEAEYLFRRSILSEIGEMRCRDLKAEHLRAVLRKLAGTGLSYESVSKVRFAMGDMVKRMVAEQYLTSNIAAGLKTPKTARRSDRSRLRRVTLAEYLRAWTALISTSAPRGRNVAFPDLNSTIIVQFSAPQGIRTLTSGPQAQGPRRPCNEPKSPDNKNPARHNRANCERTINLPVPRPDNFTRAHIPKGVLHLEGHSLPAKRATVGGGWEGRLEIKDNIAPSNTRPT
jgi:hypothetical protein